MATNVSSVLGASLTSSDTTQLFALGTRINTTDGATFEYVEATSTLTTGELCIINPSGSALLWTTALLAAVGANGQRVAAPQFLISQGEFGFVATQGRNLYVLCTGTIAAGTGVGLGAGGTLQAMAAASAGATLAGIHITTSASTATASVAIATITYPRGLVTTGVQQ